MLGWIVGLALIGTIVLVVAGGAGATERNEPATWVSVLMLVLGALLLVLAVRQWRRRPRAGEEAAMPLWMRTVDHFTPVRSVAIAFALSALNPKNLLLTVGAAAAIAQTWADAAQEAVALAVFVLIGTLGTGVPVALYFALGDRATRLLDDLKTWMAANNAAIMAVLCLIIGAKLIGDGISGLG